MVTADSLKLTVPMHSPLRWTVYLWSFLVRVLSGKVQWMIAPSALMPARDMRGLTGISKPSRSDRTPRGLFKT